jgi:hypothetical protein
MAYSEREPDGTLQLMQDEMCGHILLIPANEDDVYKWDYERSQRFASEDEAIAWHDENCPILLKKKRS